VVHGGKWGFEDPEGVVQEVLLKLLHLVRQGRVDRAGGFQKYVHTVARYSCVNQLHRERRRAQREIPHADPEWVAASDDPHEEVERRERVELLRFVVHRLSESCRQLWESVYVDRRSSGDLAEDLGITVNNLRVRVHRCLEKARGIYRELSGDTPPGGVSPDGVSPDGGRT